jgi:hypothetical protein
MSTKEKVRKDNPLQGPSKTERKWPKMAKMNENGKNERKWQK